MFKLLLTIALLFGFAVGARGQVDAGAAASPVASAGAPNVAGAVAPAQPIAFNHKLHIQTAKLTCNDCHEPNRGGATLAIPQPPKCMLCHAAIATEKPDVQRLAEAAKNNDLIAWVRVYRVPSFVTFSHKTHTSSGATCEDCHGPVAERTAIAPEKDLKMGGCIACHQARSAPASCDTCHAIMSKNGRSPFDADADVLARLHLPQPVPSATLAASLHEGFLAHAGGHSALAVYLDAPGL